MIDHIADPKYITCKMVKARRREISHTDSGFWPPSLETSRSLNLEEAGFAEQTLFLHVSLGSVPDYMFAPHDHVLLTFITHTHPWKFSYLYAAEGSPGN